MPNTEYGAKTLASERSVPLLDPVETAAMTADRKAAIENERKLVDAARNGDITAFVALCNPHAEKLRRSLYRITQDWADAEDAMQNSFMLAYRNVGGFEGRARFSTWLTRIAVNAALGILRKRRMRRETFMEVSIECSREIQPRDIIDPVLNPESQYSLHEHRARLRAAIATLRPSEREVLELFYFEDQRVAEIAADLGLSIPAVKSRLLRAKRALHKSVSRATANPLRRSTPNAIVRAAEERQYQEVTICA